MMRGWIAIPLVAALGVVLHGCSYSVICGPPIKGYSGPEKPLSELAIIEACSFERLDATIVETKCTRDAYVEPGTHSFATSEMTNTTIFYSTYTIQVPPFCAEPGKIYRCEYDYDISFFGEDEYYWWVEEVGTGSIIFGTHPSFAGTRVPEPCPID